MIKEILAAISAVISTIVLVYTTFFKRDRKKGHGTMKIYYILL